MKKRSIAIAVAISAIMVISSLSVAYSSGDFNHGNLSAATNLQPSYISNHSNNVVIHHNSMNKTDGSRNGYGQAVSYSVSSAVNLSANDLSQNRVLLYPVNFVQAGLPIGTEWNITLEGRTHSTYNITYSTYLPNGNYSYNISNSGVFYPVQPSGEFSIKSSGIHVDILFRSEAGISSTLSFENNSIIQGIYSYHETGYGPYNAIYNPVNGLFYSANVYNGTVSIINASIGKIYKTLKVGMDPVSLAVNPSSGTVYVANLMSSSISYISINNTVTMNLSVSDFPSHILFDPISGNLFITNLSDTMTMIGPTNGISSVNFNSPVSQIVLDSHNGNIFVKTSATIYTGLKGGAKQIYYLSGNGSLLYGFNLTRNTSPNSVIYNSANNRVYSIFSIISGHSLMESSVNGTVIKTWDLGYGPDEMYYNNGSGSFYIFSYRNENTTIHIYNGFVEPLNNITLVGEIQGIAFGASLDTAVLPDSYNNELYISSPIYNTRSVTLSESGIAGNNKWGISYEGHEYISTSTFLNFTISDNSFSLNFLNVSGYEKPISININSGFRNVVLEAKYLKLYNVVIAENGLPDMLSWTIILHNETLSINGNSIVLNLTNGTYPLTILKSGSYYPDPSNETLAVMGSGLNIMIEFSASTYGVYFKEQGLPSDTLWYLNLSNGENYKSTGSFIKFSAPNSTFYYSIATGNKSFTPFNHTGIFTVAGKGDYINVSFRMVTYSVNVSESGLPLGTSWYFGLQGSGNLASFNGSSFSMNLPNGTYSYYVKSSNSEYFPAMNAGSFTIHGSSVGISIIFKKMTYNITIHQSGLPSGTIWYVNLTDGRSIRSNMETGSIQLPNGTYQYTVSTNDKTFAPSKYMSDFVVNGSPISLNLTFHEVVYNITFESTSRLFDSGWTLFLNGENVSSTTGRELSLNLSNGTYTYSAVPWNDIYRGVSGNFTVNGNGLSLPLYFHVVRYTVQIKDQGLPQNTQWFFNLSNGIEISSITGSMAIELTNGTYVYSVSTGNSSFHPISASGIIKVQGANISYTIVFKETLYRVTFVNDLNNGVVGSIFWYINLSNGDVSGPISLGGNYTFELQNGTYRYNTGSSNDSFRVNPGNGILNVNGTGLQVYVSVQKVNYTVVFNSNVKEVPWEVTIGGHYEFSPRGGPISFQLSNGTYSYNAMIDRNGDGHHYEGQINGTVVVEGKNITVDINFERLHKVNIHFIDPPPDYSWTISLQNTTYIGDSSAMKLFLANGNYSALLSLNISMSEDHSDQSEHSHHHYSNIYLDVTVPFNLTINGHTSIFIVLVFAHGQFSVMIFDFNVPSFPEPRDIGPPTDFPQGFLTHGLIDSHFPSFFEIHQSLKNVDKFLAFPVKESGEKKYLFSSMLMIKSL